MSIFDSTIKPKLIYVFAISDDKHNGCLKIGEATILDSTNLSPQPNSKELNQSAKARIDQYTKTAGISYQLLYTEATLFVDAKKHITSFNDKQVHQVLENSGVQKVSNAGWGNEWFHTDLETIKKAIAAVKQGRSSLTAGEITKDKSPIIFRPEQRDAIDKTIKKFQHGNRMLWNAKMRFGKTLSALQVVKEMQFTRTLILTHRPTVNDGWFEDFRKIFYDDASYDYGSKTNGNFLDTMELAAAMGTMKYVYFASMQDLRGSEKVGGKFNKNDLVFKTHWDLIIVDEAHEGTQTQLGQNVMAELSKQDSKVLKLSGTPFNLLDEYTDDEVYTWDYTMEQMAKSKWDENYFGDPNPYASLPTMNIYTYDLGKLMADYGRQDVAFNFSEFLRVKNDGTFVHEKDVKKFLDLLTEEDKDSCYPFANQAYRDNFKHTLWMVPGVKSAKALSTLLKNHNVFGNFEIVNVAGEGDEEIDTHDALNAVKQAIKENEYTITLSCGRLTTGVSVPQWTAVLMICGSFNTAAASYMQTIFRVQTPWTYEGKTKEQCYVFDFAPDRTLKVIAETAKVSAKAGKTTENDRKTLGKFLNFCPIISFSGSKMSEKITADKLFKQLKKVYVERVVRSGFDDTSLYNDELLKMDSLDLDDFKELKKKIGTTKAMPRTGDIDVNNQGLTEEEYERHEELEKKKRKHELTPEQEKELEQLKRAKKNRQEAISILRGISIRMPLLIYGAELTEEDGDVSIENFARLIDDNSWEEFMPAGITKLDFSTFRKYYDKDIFIEAGRKIRSLARAADKMGVEERIERITSLFANFRNPDKETVLTPWRVVNMHLGDCLGGYNFYNDTYSEGLEEPRYIDHGEITENVFSPNSHILEINSKTGLYPLYVAYNIYRTKAKNSLFSTETIEEQQQLWDEVLRDNVFVICKTRMAQSITKRTLVGFRKAKTNTHAFDDLINQITNKQPELIDKISKGMLFKNFKDMNFNAIVGNPPYQVMDGGTQTGAVPVYHHFVEIAKKLSPRYLSMIMPSRWFAGGRGLDDFRAAMLNDRHIRVLVDFPKSRDCFSNVDIAGGICYFLRDKEYQGDCTVVSSIENVRTTSIRKLNQFSIFIRDNMGLNIINKVLLHNEETLDKHVLSVSPFGIRSFVRGADIPFPNSLLLKSSSGNSYIESSTVTKNNDLVGKYKIMCGYLNPDRAGVNNSKDGSNVTTKLTILKPNEVVTETYIVLGVFDDEKTALNFASYIKTRFARFLVFQTLSSMHITQTSFQFVPVQDFSKAWNDAELYKKYNLTIAEIEFINKMIKKME